MDERNTPQGYKEDDSHMHAHDHDRTHPLPDSASIRLRLTIAVAVTVTVLVAELVAAFLSGFLSLAADAGHMAVDSSGLVVALIASRLATKPRTDERSWGFARAEVLAGGLQAGMLMVLTAVIVVEALPRLAAPPSMEPLPVLVVGGIGLVANAVSFAVLAGGRNDNLNIRAAFLEVTADALGSLAVILAALVTLTTGWGGADALASLVIAAFMAPRALSLLRASARILLETAPEGLDAARLRAHLEAMPGVEDVHDLHVSTISTGVVTLTAHLKVSAELDARGRDALVALVRECAATHFPVAIGHTTIEVDSASKNCADALVHP